jgi:putative ubiquitin-RnfH superfamily antitoxin RatB of RatAB toxin-antitoxin module
MITIEIVYAGVDPPIIRALRVPENCALIDALQQSNILTQCPEINLERNKVGIFSQLATLETTLHDGDRVEIYQPLLIDPKQARKLRANRRKNTLTSSSKDASPLDVEGVEMGITAQEIVQLIHEGRKL